MNFAPSGLGTAFTRAHLQPRPRPVRPIPGLHWHASYVSAFSYVEECGTAAQADRERHDLLRLHAGYAAEAAYALDETVPAVWQYLLLRQFNNFRPCPMLTDVVAGYELPAEVHDLPEVQRMVALGCNATTIINDLYSYMKELRSNPAHLNLPRMIQAETGCAAKDAYLEAVRVHNKVMDAFEEQCALLAAARPLPQLARFCSGVSDWVDRNHWWHATNSHRYSLPDFWDEEEVSQSGPSICGQSIRGEEPR